MDIPGFMLLMVLVSLNVGEEISLEESSETNFETPSGLILSMDEHFNAAIGPKTSSEGLRNESEVIFSDLNLTEAIKGEIILEAVTAAGVHHPVSISPRNYKGPIYVSDLEWLKSLIAANREIRDLSGLEYCVNLKTLDLSGNHLTNVSSLSRLTNLELLVLNDNQITNVSPLSSLINLKALYISGNPITDVSPLYGLTNLEYTDMGIFYIPEEENMLTDPEMSSNG